MWSQSVASTRQCSVTSSPRDTNSRKLTSQPYEGTPGSLHGTVVDCPAKGQLQEGWAEQARVPGNAPVKLVSLAEAERRAKVRPWRKEEVQDAIPVAARKPATENFEVRRNPYFTGGVFERVIDHADPNLIDRPERVVSLSKRLNQWRIRGCGRMVGLQ